MQDRLRFRAVLNQDKYEKYRLEPFINQKIFDVKTIHVGYEDSTVEIIAEYPNGDWAIREIDEADIDLMQCTGLKDKNGTLIYEGDIVKIFHVSSTGQGNLSKRYVAYDEDKARYIFCEEDFMSYITVNTDDIFEVIGNIYENKELLE